MDGKTERNFEAALDGFDENKRAVLRGFLKGAFVAPVVATFPMSGLMLDPAHAQTTLCSVPNMSCVPE